MTGLHSGEEVVLKTPQIPLAKMATMMISMVGVGNITLGQEQIQIQMREEVKAEVKAGTLVLPMPFEICGQDEEMPMQELVHKLLLSLLEAGHS
jgi:hypothetical protein